eukprot:jgi/Botrbrau1/7303/Bobra.0318s0035.1
MWSCPKPWEFLSRRGIAGDVQLLDVGVGWANADTGRNRGGCWRALDICVGKRTKRDAARPGGVNPLLTAWEERLTFADGSAYYHKDWVQRVRPLQSRRPPPKLATQHRRRAVLWTS